MRELWSTVATAIICVAVVVGIVFLALDSSGGASDAPPPEKASYSLSDDARYAQAALNVACSEGVSFLQDGDGWEYVYVICNGGQVKLVKAWP